MPGTRHEPAAAAYAQIDILSGWPALCPLEPAVEELQDRALAGAVAAEQTDALAALDGEPCAVEHGRSTERDADVLHAE